MIKQFAIASAYLLCTGLSANAATFSCLFGKDDAIVDESCALDTAGTQECQYAYSTETTPLVGFCYALAADEAASKTLLGCGFASPEANIAAMSQARPTDAAGRATPSALEPGFFALGDTVGTPDDVLVAFSDATNAATFIAYCVTGGT